MPTYDYRCEACDKRSSIVQSYDEYGIKSVQCPHCGSDRLKRLINRVRFARSEESRLDNLADPGAWGDFDENDPRTPGHRRVSQNGWSAQNTRWSGSPRTRPADAP